MYVHELDLPTNNSDVHRRPLKPAASRNGLTHMLERESALCTVCLLTSDSRVGDGRSHMTLSAGFKGVQKIYSGLFNAFSIE